MKCHELLSGPDKFTTGEYARDSLGDPVKPQSSAAVCWCTLGAVNRCYAYQDELYEVKRKLQETIGNIALWNDFSTYEEVIAVLKELDI